MQVSIVKAFALMVASGRGQECNDLVQELHRTLCVIDPETQKSKTWLLKSGKNTHLSAYYRVGSELAGICFPRLRSLPERFLAQNNGKVLQ